MRKPERADDYIFRAPVSGGVLRRAAAAAAAGGRGPKKNYGTKIHTVQHTAYWVQGNASLIQSINQVRKPRPAAAGPACMVNFRQHL